MDKNADIDIMDHVGFVTLVARRYSRKDDHLFEDLYQEGILGLLRAKETFDPERGYKFLTYATWWIQGYISRYLKKDFKKPLTVEDIEVYKDSISTTDSVEAQVVFDNLREKAVQYLHKVKASDREIDIFLSRSLSEEPVTLQSLGDKYGVTRQRIEQIERRTLKKLKRRNIDYGPKKT